MTTTEKKKPLSDEKLKALQITIDKIEKDFGKGNVMMMNEKTEVQEVISTGSIGLDIALRIGGLPRVRVIEIYGPESSGKTTIATHVIAEAQKKGGLGFHCQSFLVIGIIIVAKNADYILSQFGY